jgi:hypothetical protein
LGGGVTKNTALYDVLSKITKTDGTVITGILTKDDEYDTFAFIHIHAEGKCPPNKSFILFKDIAKIEKINLSFNVEELISGAIYSITTTDSLINNFKLSTTLQGCLFGIKDFKEKPGVGKNEGTPVWVSFTKITNITKISS